MKKLAVAIVLFVLVLAGVSAYFIMKNNSSANPSSSNAQTNTIDPQGTADVQEISLGMKDFNYYPRTITVKANTPVRLTLDSTVSGCYRQFLIPGLGVNKYSQNPSQTIDFTPTKPGTYRFQCGMNMGYGEIIVS